MVKVVFSDCPQGHCMITGLTSVARPFPCCVVCQVTQMVAWSTLSPLVAVRAKRRNLWFLFNATFAVFPRRIDFDGSGNRLATGEAFTGTVIEHVHVIVAAFRWFRCVGRVVPVVGHGFDWVESSRSLLACAAARESDSHKAAWVASSSVW